MPNYYQDLVHRLDPAINSAGVEASMRLQYGTLDHLTPQTFADEIKLARQCQEQDPDFLHSIAASYGLTADFSHWAQRLGSPVPPDQPPDQMP